MTRGPGGTEPGAVAVFLTAASPLIGVPIGVVALVPAAAFAALLLRRGNWRAADPPAALVGVADRAPTDAPA